MKRRFLSILICVIMLLSLTGVLTQTDSMAASIKLSKKKITLYVGDSVKLKLKNAKGTVKWKSSKTSVAKVSKGKVTAKKKGKATIKATYKKKTYKCTVTVKDKPFETATSAVKNMKIGWNLGNYFDATLMDMKGKSVEEFLTCWGNPIVDEAFFKKLKNLGFGAIRFPITWAFHYDDEGNIDPKWMAKVKETVDYILKNDMYCIINMHHDTGAYNVGLPNWLFASSKNFGEQKGMYKALWKNIATAFKDYPQTLIFESFNEMVSEDDNYSDDAKAAINDYNQAFVDTVRSTGACNLNRNLICSVYSGQAFEEGIQGFDVPQDKVKDHIIGEVHFYDPYEFTNKNSEPDISTLGPDQEKLIDSVIDMVGKAFSSKGADKSGIPAIIGEFATTNKNNTADRIKWFTRVITDAKKWGMPCFIWDNGMPDEMGYIDRTGGLDPFPDIIKACIDAAKKT